jgi:hypothetical protein
MYRLIAFKAMDKYFVQTQQLAGNGGAMEAETIQKNAARPKSLTSRVNRKIEAI